VHVVGTTGGIVDPDELDAPANAHLVAFANHEVLMGRAALVVGRGGHGTTMRALRRGLPIVGMPARGADQAPITALLDEWKVGIALPGDADVDALRSAAARVLADDAYRRNAQELALGFSGLDGAALAADSVESLLG